MSMTRILVHRNTSMGECVSICVSELGFVCLGTCAWAFMRMSRYVHVRGCLWVQLRVLLAWVGFGCDIIHIFIKLGRGGLLASTNLSMTSWKWGECYFPSLTSRQYMGWYHPSLTSWQSGVWNFPHWRHGNGGSDTSPHWHHGNGGIDTSPQWRHGNEVMILLLTDVIAMR